MPLQLRASWYRAWARRLASWGFAVVQYDDPLLRIIPDAIEVPPTQLQYDDSLLCIIPDAVEVLPTQLEHLFHAVVPDSR